LKKNGNLKKLAFFYGKIFYRNPGGLKKLFFVFFWIFWIFDAELLGAGQRNFGLPIIIFYTLPAVWGGNPSG
jgi:hypothetical protein